LLLALGIAVILESESRRTRDHVSMSQIPDFPSLEGQVPVFISPKNRVDRLCPQALSSLFVASYDSQGYGGGIRTRLHGAEKLIVAQLVKIFPDFCGTRKCVTMLTKTEVTDWRDGLGILTTRTNRCPSILVTRLLGAVVT
jgi:hypothetical protein